MENIDFYRSIYPKREYALEEAKDIPNAFVCRNKRGYFVGRSTTEESLSFETMKELHDKGYDDFEMV